MRFSVPRLYAIIDPAAMGAKSPAEVCAELLEGGVRLIQYRAKRATTSELYETCLALAPLARRAGGSFLVNDRADVARAVDADGVHLGQKDLPVELARRVLGPCPIIGISTHSLEQVLEADRSSAQYVAFGPIFATASKDSPDPVVGLEGLSRARSATKKPLVAIGGITLDNARSVMDAGADSVAVIGGLLSTEDVGRRAREFLNVLGESGEEASSYKF